MYVFIVRVRHTWPNKTVQIVYCVQKKKGKFTIVYTENIAKKKKENLNRNTTKDMHFPLPPLQIIMLAKSRWRKVRLRAKKSQVESIPIVCTRVGRQKPGRSAKILSGLQTGSNRDWDFWDKRKEPAGKLKRKTPKDQVRSCADRKTFL